MSAIVAGCFGWLATQVFSIWKQIKENIEIEEQKFKEDKK
jgi:hypothetical protein